MIHVGLSAMGLDKNLNQVSVYRYSITIESGIDEELSPVRLTRKVARLTANMNGWKPVTDIGHFLVVALLPLTQLDIDSLGLKFTLALDTVFVLNAAVNEERAAIQRLLNQDFYRAAYKLTQIKKLQDGTRQFKASRSNGGWTELQEIQPSERIDVKSNYLELFKSLRLAPELLPDGQVILGLFVKHRICAKGSVTLDWVIRKRPEWLSHIKRVRHRYTDRGNIPMVVDLEGLVADKTSGALVPGTSNSLYEYHEARGRIQAGQEEIVRNSNVVKVSYGKDRKGEHLAALLEPIFDFDTLQKIDSPLLNRIAKGLKWPIIDRLRASGEMIRGMELPGFFAKVVPADFSSRNTENICPRFNLLFHKGALGESEKEVLSLKAFKGMSRTQVVCLAVGTKTKPEVLREHFSKLREACQKLCAEPIPSWKGVSSPQPLQNASELNIRLHRTPQDNTLLVIAIDKSVNKTEVRDVAFRHKLACQFMLTDHSPKVYQSSYYNNLAAGVFSKGGGLICGLADIPGDVDLFIGLDMGGVHQRVPGSAFLFTRNGAQLGWQLADLQSGERLEDAALASLLKKSIQEYMLGHEGEVPRNITIHRDGRFFENLDVIQALEAEFNTKICVLEVIKSGAPVLFRKHYHDGCIQYVNPEVGDVYRFNGIDELILATYSGSELKSWGDKVSVRPLRLRKRYGNATLDVLAQQVLLLSRIHGASLYRHPRLPVTTHHADRFATLRQLCNLEALSHMDRTCPVYL